MKRRSTITFLIINKDLREGWMPTYIASIFDCAYCQKSGRMGRKEINKKLFSFLEGLLLSF